ncbi:MAG TPA: hypothetical protein VH682_06425 [Gemmataceae bacterium]
MPLFGPFDTESLAVGSKLVHQRFALMALKTFFKTDYRGLTHMLDDFAELRQHLGLAAPPHYSTLGYAAWRLLKKGRSSCSSIAPPRAPKKAV